MQMVIHDLEPNLFRELFPDAQNIYVLDKSMNMHSCTGCFSCWIKTPCQCMFNDVCKEMGRMLSKCSGLTIITRGAYGGYSYEVKTIVDRILAYILPFFVVRNNELHHPIRYENRLKLNVHFYGELSAAERETACKIVNANAVNLDTPDFWAHFYANAQALKGIAL